MGTVPAPERSARARDAEATDDLALARPARGPLVAGGAGGAEGVLPGQSLESAIRAGYIDAGRFKIPPENVQPASIDLRLGERVVRIRCSFLPGRETVEHKLKDL